jgi:hypothetical protein
MCVKRLGKMIENEAYLYVHANASLKRQKMCLSFNQALKSPYVGKNPHVWAWAT